jgi:lysine-N-methylase
MDVLPTKYIAPKYVTRFRCIGADCEEACCSGWQVAVDAHHYDKLEQRMNGASEESEEFARKLRRVEEVDRRNGKYALIVLNESGDCSFYGADRLCTLHKRYGHEFLSDTCAAYPRQVGLVGTRVELTAKVSCPEVARQLLLAPDAMTIVDIPGAAVERGAVNQSLAENPPELYERAVDDVRGTILGMLGDLRYPFASRLAFVACLADELGPLFYRGSTAADALVIRVLERGGSDEIRKLSHREFSAVEVPDEFATMIVLRVILSCMHAGAGTFGRLIRSIFAQAGCDPSAPAPVGQEKARLVLALYESSKKRCEIALGPRLDAYFSRYAMNYFLQDWYTSAPSLAAHTGRLVLRVALLRFLVLCHPSIAQGTADEQTLDRAAVEVFFKFSRGVEHNPQFLAAIEKDFRERAADIAHAMFLAKF